MSDEGHKFTPGPGSKFPALIMRAYIGENQFVEWVFTPPESGGWFEYKFEAKQENEILHINFDQNIMMPKAGR